MTDYYLGRTKAESSGKTNPISGRREGARGERRVASGGRTIARVLRALMAAGTPRFPYISIQFTVHLFRPWIPSRARSVVVGPRRFTAVVLNEQSLPSAWRSHDGIARCAQLAGCCLSLLVLSKTLVRSGLKSSQQDLSRLRIGARSVTIKIFAEDLPARNVTQLCAVLAVTCHLRFAEGSTHCEYR